MPSYKDAQTGRWYCSFYYTDLRGKRIRKLKRGFALKREADKWERDFLSQEHKDEITFNVLSSEFEKDLENKMLLGNIKRSTLELYKRQIRQYITPHFKDFIVSKIQARHINEWLCSITEIKQKPLNKEGRYYKMTLNKKRRVRRSSCILNSIKAMLSRIFEFGVINYGLRSNPVKQVESVKSFSNDTRAKLWTIEQFKVFREHLTRQDMKVLFDTIYFSGLRLGEVLALTPKDIQQKCIIVTKTLIKPVKGEKYIDKPKTASSVRTVAIPEFLYDEIMEFIGKTPYIEEDSFIFNIEANTARNHLDNKARQAGLPHISPHILRHSYASNVIFNSDYVVASSLLGHANPNITLKVYAHRLPDSDSKAIQALEAMNPNK